MRQKLLRITTWDPDLAKTAKAWAKRCQFKHNTYLKEPGQTHPRFTSVGENIWTGSLSIFSVKEAITSWYNEVKDYSYTANSCRRVCGHYTQIVWARSYKVGCAVHFCPTVQYFSGKNAALFICNYGPAGWVLPLLPSHNVQLPSHNVQPIFHVFMGPQNRDRCTPLSKQPFFTKQGLCDVAKKQWHCVQRLQLQPELYRTWIHKAGAARGKSLSRGPSYAYWLQLG
uniref:SCP domain-containing protein n=1 Tax=Anas platyrhynchos platyrhynchos TaxID=8840 RepID=A0A493TNN1_ANAPP